MSPQEVANELCISHGGLRKAAKAIHMSIAMLSRIRTGVTVPVDDLAAFMERQLKKARR